LSESLGLSHENPHQADSDAQVTAELLLLIQEKIEIFTISHYGKNCGIKSTDSAGNQYFYSTNV